MQNIHCEYVGKCGGCSINAQYQAQLESKKQYILQLFDLGNVPLCVFGSKEIGYRTRAEFRIFRTDFHSTKHHTNSSHTNPYYINLSMMSATNTTNKKAIKIPIKSCPILLPNINLALQNLISAINTSAKSNKQDFDTLAHKLYAIEALGVLNPAFLDSANYACDKLQKPLSVILTLIYHKKLEAQWEQAITKLLNKIPQNIALIGRSKNQKITLKTDFLLESIALKNNQHYVFLRSEGKFSQPNAFINPLMISFVKEAIELHKREDLLEMYCGEGNFCVSLAHKFRQVLATEVVKSCIPALQTNAKNNGIANITALRLSGAETIEALSGKREFFRTRGVDLSDFRFSHILIDPPRSGISGGKISWSEISEDKSTKNHNAKNALEMLEFIAKHRYIIYISCNPLSLKCDLEILLKTHNITHFGLFDQFPHTNHIECVTLLECKD